MQTAACILTRLSDKLNKLVFLGRRNEGDLLHLVQENDGDRKRVQHI